MKNKNVLWISLGVLALGLGAFLLFRKKDEVDTDRKDGVGEPSFDTPPFGTPPLFPKEIKIKLPSEKKQSQENLAKQIGLSEETMKKLNLNVTPTNIGMGSYNFPPNSSNIDAINRITKSTPTRYTPTSFGNIK